MRAFVIHSHGGPEVLEWGEVDRPDPAADEVLVRVRACALNRLDLWVRNGVPGHEFPLPLIPGSEVSGIIEEVGSAVRGVKPGEPVLIAPGVSTNQEAIESGRENIRRGYGLLGEHRDGGYAEFVAVPRRNVLPKPERLGFVEAAALPLVFLTAWHMVVERAKLEGLEDILVHAAGSGVSSAAIQIARLLGARRIIATAGTSEKLEKARALGATDVIDYENEDFVEAVKRITGKKGVEVAVDHVGGKTFERTLRTLAWGGRVVFCGATTDHLAQINLRAAFYKSLSILGSTMGPLSELRRLLEFVENGQLEPVVDRTFPLEQAPEAQSLLEQRGQFGKIVLTVGEESAAPTS